MVCGSMVTFLSRGSSYHRRAAGGRCDRPPTIEPQEACVPGSTHPRAAVEVDALRKTYPGGVEAVRGVSFTVAPGEVFGLLGPNGAGKSTTVGMLTTTIAPTGGRAWLAGFGVAREPLAARAVAGLRLRRRAAGRARGEQRRLPGGGGRPRAQRPRQPRAARPPVGRPA